MAAAAEAAAAAAKASADADKAAADKQAAAEPAQTAAAAVEDEDAPLVSPEEMKIEEAPAAESGGCCIIA